MTGGALREWPETKEPAVIEKKGILALDLSGTCGWAFGCDGDLVPAFGSWQLSESSLLGPKFVAYENELIAALERLRPRLCVMEAPLPAMSQGSTNVARLQFGLAAITEAECWRARVQVREQAASTARKAVIGQGRWAKGTAKHHVIAYCRSQGWSVSDDHQADALILLAFSHRVQRERAGR